MLPFTVSDLHLTESSRLRESRFVYLNIKHPRVVNPASNIATTEYFSTYRSSLDALWHMVRSPTVPASGHRSVSVREVARSSIVFMVLFVRSMGGSNNADGNAVFGLESKGHWSNCLVSLLLCRCFIVEWGEG